MNAYYCSVGILLAIVLGTGIAAAEEPKTSSSNSSPRPVATAARGTVIETMNADRYTYVRVDTGAAKFWAASFSFPVEVGDKVVVPRVFPMKDFYSRTLERTFDTIYFVSELEVEGRERSTPLPSAHVALPAGHPPVHRPSAEPEAEIDFSDIVRAKGGKTVAEAYAQRDRLAGKQVSIRGKVVKYNEAVMGRNWVHLRDGTGTKGSNDVTVTTKWAVDVGDTVVVSGILNTNRAFGVGYRYAVIVEDAKVTIEE